MVRCNVRALPTANWTRPQFWEVASGEQAYRFLFHDHHSIYVPQVDFALEGLDLRTLMTPYRAPGRRTVKG